MRRIVHISDLHFGRHEPVLVDALVAEVNARPTDLVVVSGDLTQRARHDEFAAARAFLDRVHAPAFVVPGNHDLPLHNLFRRFWRPLSRFSRFIASDVDPFYADEEVAIVGLSTPRRLTGPNGRLSHAQINAIERHFATAPRNALRILVTHHPLATPEGEWPTRPSAFRSSAALAAIRRAGVDILLSGHYHRAVTGALPTVEMVAGARSVLLVHAGTAISNRRRNEPNSFNVLALDGDRFALSLMCWTETEGRFVERRCVRYALGQEGWMPLPAQPPAHATDG